MNLKSRRFKIVFCALLFLLLFLVLCLCVPFLRHRVLRVPIKTDTLFPEPDRIICHYNDKSYRFSKKQTALLYGLFLADDTTAFTTEEYTKSINDKTSSFWWEFKYYDVYRYTATPQDAEAFTSVFTKLAMQHASGGLALSYTYMGLSLTSLTGENLLCKNRYATGLMGSMSQMIVAHMMDTDVWEVQNETPHISNHFAAMPDEIYIYWEGQAQVITSKHEISYIFSLFEDGFTQLSVSNLADRTVAKNTDFIQKISQNICIEFRYKQRQQYVNNEISIDPDEINSSCLVQEYYNNCQYDKFLFTWEWGENQLFCAVGYGHSAGYQAALEHPWYPPVAVLEALELYTEELLF
ncbi:MAG: hypothetical protein E7639_06435 [Ruminococcaceae bacterium]|nr:hypothetical protein [Oscillospiraceae bacterium]